MRKIFITGSKQFFPLWCYIKELFFHTIKPAEIQKIKGNIIKYMIHSCFAFCIGNEGEEIGKFSYATTMISKEIIYTHDVFWNLILN